VYLTNSASLVKLRFSTPTGRVQSTRLRFYFLIGMLIM